MPDKMNLPANEGSGMREHLVPLSLLLLLAAALRLASWFNEPLLNPDGIAYILQAKAFYLHQTEPFLTAYPYPTNLALMIAGIYRLVGDWILAGQLISILFSLLTIIPFYFLNRIFWPRRTAITIVILYVISPVFVELAHEIIRGPQFWFFLVFGLWGFCRFLEMKSPSPLLLMITSTAFIMAAWSRIEGLLPLLLAAGWLLFDSDFRKRGYLAAYFLPFFLILIFSGGLALSQKSLPINLLEILSQGFGDRLQASINRFQWLRNSLLNLEANPPLGVVPYFFDKTRDLLWFLALGVTGHSLIKTFGIIFFPITLFGLIKNRSSHSEESSQRHAKLFLKLFILGGAIIIYLQILLNWSSSERFVALIYFPALIFSGYGFNKLFSGWHKRYPNSSPAAYLWLCLLLLAFALPSILKSSHLSRALAFKEIGQSLAERHTVNQEIRLCSTSKKALFTHFYAHLDQPMVSSPWEQCDIIKVNDLEISSIIGAKYDFLLLCDRDGGRRKFLAMVEKRPDLDVAVILEKNTEKYGRLTLFALQPRKDVPRPDPAGEKK